MVATGCTTTRTLPEWQAVELGTTEITRSVDCQWPDIRDVVVSGEAGGFLDADGLSALTACRDVYDFNRAIANNNADAVESLVDIVDQVNRLGQLQTEVAERELQRLEEDRRDAKLESWLYKLTTLILAGAAL